MTIDLRSPHYTDSVAFGAGGIIPAEVAPLVLRSRLPDSYGRALRYRKALAYLHPVKGVIRFLAVRAPRHSKRHFTNQGHHYPLLHNHHGITYCDIEAFRKPPLRRDRPKRPSNVPGNPLEGLRWDAWDVWDGKILPHEKAYSATTQYISFRGIGVPPVPNRGNQRVKASQRRPNTVPERPSRTPLDFLTSFDSAVREARAA